MMRWLWPLFFVTSVAACGGAETPAERPREPPPVRLLTEELDARPPLSAVTLESQDIAVLVASSDGELSVVFGAVGEDGWATDEARRVQVTSDLRGTAAILADGAHVLVAATVETGLAITRVSPDGALSPIVTSAEVSVSHVALTRGGDGAVWVVWSSSGEGTRGISAAHVSEGTLEKTPLAFDSRHVEAIDVAPTATSIIIARATEAGVEVQSPGGEVSSIRAVTAREVAFAGGAADTLGWTDDDGVHVVTIVSGVASEPRLVDGGDRVGEAAHRVGAALSLARDGETMVAAYQDQTRGSLVSARIGRVVTRREHRGRRLTRAFDIGLVATDDALLSFDLGLRTDRAVTGTVRVERLR